jgi:DNA-binding transcriptional regulator YiaG
LHLANYAEICNNGTTIEKGGLIMANNTAFCNRIREIRKAKNMTLVEISSSIGISVAYLSDIERGNRHGSNGTLQRIADALGVSVTDLEVA